MKAYHIIQLLLLLCAVSLNVEAQEIDHDKITFTVTLDRDNPDYKPGEPMKFTFKVDFGEQAPPEKNYSVFWVRSGDDGIRKSGEFTVVPGKAEEVVVSTDKPGFVRLEAWLRDSEGKNIPVTFRKGNHAVKRQKAFDGGAGVEIFSLKQAVADAAKAGYAFSFGSELEFYLFRLDENGEVTDVPYDQATYMDVAPEDRCENVRREICLTLERMGIQPESSHHEEGPGQNEVDFRYSDPLSAADNAVTFLTVVKTIAARNGLYADFSPRPLEGRPGSGFHINMSVQGGAEALMHRAMGGILDKITDMTLFLNPTEQSYSRLGAHKAPKYISWSSNNRSQLIRVPAASGEYRRFELRSPDCTANPYLAFALLIWAGLFGIENDIALPEACNVNLHTADSRNVTLATLPRSLPDAEKCAADSNFIAQHLPQSLIEFFTK